MRYLIFFVCLLGMNVVAHAELVQVDDNSFYSRHRMTISASPAKVWRGLTRDISRWWDPAQTLGGDAANMLMQTKVGGCLCELQEDQKRFEHLRVIVVYENQILRLRGALGPLRGLGAAGTMNFKLAPIADVTKLEYKYIVSGAGGKKIANTVDQLMLDQLERLKKYIESN